ncbi:hypothetical protein NFJ02_04g115560 [Pycnococcus provasolii]
MTTSLLDHASRAAIGVTSGLSSHSSSSMSLARTNSNTAVSFKTPVLTSVLHAAKRHDLVDGSGELAVSNVSVKTGLPVTDASPNTPGGGTNTPAKRKGKSAQVIEEERRKMVDEERRKAALSKTKSQLRREELSTAINADSLNEIGIQHHMARAAGMRRDLQVRRARAIVKVSETRPLKTAESQELCALMSLIFQFARQLPVDSLEDLVSVVKHRSCKEGEVLCHQGEEGDAFYMVLNGVVQISAKVDNKRTTKLGAAAAAATATSSSSSSSPKSYPISSVFFALADELSRDSLRFLKMQVPSLRSVDIDDVVALSRLMSVERMPAEHVFDMKQGDVALRIIRKGVVQLRVPESALMRLVKMDTTLFGSQGKANDMHRIVDYSTGQMFGSRITATSPEMMSGWQGVCMTRVECLKALTTEILNPTKLSPQLLEQMRTEVQFLLDYNIAKVAKQLHRRAIATAESSNRRMSLLLADPNAQRDRKGRLAPLGMARRTPTPTTPQPVSPGSPESGGLASPTRSPTLFIQPPTMRPAESMAHVAVEQAMHPRSASSLGLSHVMGEPPSPVDTAPRLGRRSMRALALAEAELAMEETTIARTKRLMGTRNDTWRTRGDTTTSGCTSVDKYNCYVVADRTRRLALNVSEANDARPSLYFDSASRRPVPQFRQMTTTLEIPYFKEYENDGLKDLGARGLAIEKQVRAQSSLG